MDNIEIAGLKSQLSSLQELGNIKAKLLIEQERTARLEEQIKKLEQSSNILDGTLSNIDGTPSGTKRPLDDNLSNDVKTKLKKSKG